jgi:hypothetical protein
MPEGERNVSSGRSCCGRSLTEPQQPIEHRDDDDYCWVCDGPVIKRHCKIVCPRCGFMRDCSDP